MPEFSVRLPVCGYVEVEITAKNEKEAIKKALEKSYDQDNIQEFEVLETICQGNFWMSDYANEAEADLLDEEPDCVVCKESDCKKCVFNDEE
jgi:hypothetical protein